MEYNIHMKKNKVSNILVTGGAGFIGSALCKELNNQGHSVTSFDNYSNSTMAEPINGILYVVGDCCDINEHLEGHLFDYIFHFGEYARVEQSFDDYERVMEYNYHSFPKVLEFAKKTKAKIIYAGSSTKFSEGEDGKSMSPYAYTKAQNTELLQAYASWNDMPYAIVYFYNVYGDGEVSTGKYSTVIGKFINLMNSGNITLPITSPGTQKRNFTHIDDTVDGLIKVMEWGSGDGWGIGNDTAYSLLDLAVMCGATPILKPAKPGNRMSGTVHNDYLKALGWQPKVNLQEYINEKLDI
jgi:UDP-glucose 4-epimerase